MLKRVYRNQTTSGVWKIFFFSWPSIHKTTRFNPNSIAKKIKSKVLVNNSIIFPSLIPQGHLFTPGSQYCYSLAWPDKMLSSKNFPPKNLTVPSGNHLWLLPQLYTHIICWESFSKHRYWSHVLNWFRWVFFFLYHNLIFVQLRDYFAKQRLMGE